MEGNVDNSVKTNETRQRGNEKYENNESETLKNTLSNNDDKKLGVPETLNNASTSTNNDSIVENVGTNPKDSNNSLTKNVNEQNTWIGHKDNSENRRGRGKHHKSNYNNNSFEKSWGSFDSTSNNFKNSGGHVRGRGRGVIRRSDEDNGLYLKGKDSNYNNGNTPSSHRGRGRGHNRGRGRFRDKTDGWYGNIESGHKKKEYDKPTGPKQEYIPPDIESEESIAGVEAGLNFDKYDTIEVKVSGTDAPKRMTSFQSSGLRDILIDNLAMYNFTVPTPIQNYAIPIVMAGRDMMACAQTGSGKTAAFVLPILHNLLSQPTQLVFDENHCEPQVVILAPTRELVVQICECVWKFSKGTGLRIEVLYGGTSINYQKSKILKRGVHVLIATPGRLNDFVEKSFVTFSSVKFFVLDEADRMLDMGFKPAIERVLQHPTMVSIDVRQTLMFSATFASEVQHMATTYLKPDYLFVAVGEIGGACKDVIQTVLEVAQFDKKMTLYNLLQEMENCQGTIVFVEQKRHADFLAAYLSEKNFPTTSIHGGREQPEREQALRDFKTNNMKILVATAVAARGLDIKGVNNVVNFDLPKTIDEYVHRIGRTGRLGNAGKAISFYNPECDSLLASELTRILKQAEQEVPTWLSDAAERAKQSALAGDDFNDIRKNVEVTSELVPNEEEAEW